MLYIILQINKEAVLMTSIANLQELKEMRRMFINMLYDTDDNDERRINYILDMINKTQEAINIRLKK